MSPAIHITDLGSFTMISSSALHNCSMYSQLLLKWLGLHPSSTNLGCATEQKWLHVHAIKLFIYTYIAMNCISSCVMDNQWSALVATGNTIT